MASNDQGHKQEYRRDIDGLRAIAVLSVVLFHAFPTTIKSGFIGVDIFFVISGYLISGIIIDSISGGVFSLQAFYSNRARRILPALIFTVSVVFCIGWWLLLPDEMAVLGKHIASGLLFSSNFIYWTESGYFDAAADAKPLLHLWSLAVEEQFYIVWPMLLLLAFRLKANLFTSVFCLLIASFAFNIYSSHTDPTMSFYSPIGRFWELAVGGLVAITERQKKVFLNGKFFRNYVAILGLLLLAIGFLRIDRNSTFPGYWATLPVVGTALIIAAGSGATLNRNFLSKRGLVWLGLISYPVYLWHWPLLSFSYISNGGREAGIEYRIVAVVFSLLLGWFTYTWIEKPFRKRLVPYGVKSLILSLLLLLSVAILSFFEFFIPNNSSTLYENFERNRWSSSWTFRGCEEKYLAISLGCSANSSKEPDVLIIGDSHSQGIYIKLAEALSNKDISLMRLGSYLPFPNIEVVLNKGGRGSSGDTDKILNFAANNENIDSVVVAFRGVLNLESTDYVNGKTIPVPHRSFRAVGLASESLSQQDAFEHGLRGLFELLTKRDKQVIFLIDNPELGFSPVSCADVRPFSIGVINSCHIEKKEFLKRNKEYRSLVFKVLADYPSVQYLDTQSLLCSEQICPAYRDGEFLYQDDNHLSLSGSSIVAEEVSKLLKR